MSTASLLIPSLSFLSSSSSPPPLPFLLSNNISPTPRTWNLKSHTPSPHRWNPSRRNLIRRLALDGSPVLDPRPPPPLEFKEPSPEAVASLKLKLLSAVSGLNRGLAASEEDLKRADSAAKELEAVGGLVDLSTDLDKLQGRWKLIYSSAFSSRTLGGSRPGPPTGRLLPITLGQVFQRIDILSKDFDNIVELQLGTPWPVPPIEVTATLAHKFEIIAHGRCSDGEYLLSDWAVRTVWLREQSGSVSACSKQIRSKRNPFELPELPELIKHIERTTRAELAIRAAGMPAVEKEGYRLVRKRSAF